MQNYNRGVTKMFYQFNDWMSRKDRVTVNLF